MCCLLFSCWFELGSVQWFGGIRSIDRLWTSRMAIPKYKRMSDERMRPVMCWSKCCIGTFSFISCRNCNEMYRLQSSILGHKSIKFIHPLQKETSTWKTTSIKKGKQNVLALVFVDLKEKHLMPFFRFA